MKSQLVETVEMIQTRLAAEGIQSPKIAMILGSGLGFLADHFEESCSIPYEEIPHFPRSTIVGHEGSLVIGTFEGQACICMKGRVHFYEGYPMSMITYPVRVMRRLGAERLLVTNAAGGINADFQVGDLMVIKDHINLMGTNPLIGENDASFGPRFPDMSFAYAKDLRALWHRIADAQNLTLKEGVYAAMMGPSYETPAEIKMLGIIGADAVGMSTVPEVITAVHSGMKVMGMSVITNLAAGLGHGALSHDEVKDASEMVHARLVPFIKAVVRQLPNNG